MNGGQDSRRHPRLKCAGEAEVMPYVDAVPYPARVANLSVEGCLLILLTAETLPMGAVVELLFTINQLPFRVRAQVKAVRSPTELGVQFVLMSDRSRRRLGDLMQELAEDQKRGGGVEVKAPR